MKIITITIIVLMTTLSAKSQDFYYAVAKEPTPVLNSPDFEAVFGGSNGVTVKTDNSGLIREMEFIALPGTVFELLGEFDHGTYKIFKVECKEYEYGSELFIDSRFVELKKSRPGERFVALPKKEDIYKVLDKVVGNRYCWGGNYNDGIKKLIEFKIYNRFGQLVFETADINQGWDGYYRGELQPIETYVYFTSVETWLDGEILTKKGSFNIIR